MGTERVSLDSDKSLHDFGADYRNKLLGIEAVVALKRLNNEAAAEQFISQGGDIGNIVSVLQHSDKSDAHIVLTALIFVIKKHLQVADDLSDCEQLCHQLLTVHSSKIEQAFINHKDVVLRFFTTLVQVGFHSAKTILLSYDKFLVLNRKENRSAREEYIKLVNALLAYDNTFITRTLLEKGILNKVIAGLVHDEFTSVISVLKTITSNIVLNAAVNKSLKMQVFNTSALNFLYALYNWKGTTDQQNLVRNTVHSLLIHLCTDYKKGIVYFDESYGTSKNHLNPLIYNFLKKIKSPWTDELVGDFIVKLLWACPDLVKPVFDFNQDSFHPRDSFSFYDLCKFLTKFVSDCHLVEKLTNPSLLMNIVKFKLFPLSIFNLIKKGIEFKENSVKKATYELLFVILNTFLTTLSIVKEKFSNQYQAVLDYVLFELPQLVELIKLWNDNIDNIDELNLLGDVLLTYSNNLPIPYLREKNFNLYETHKTAHPDLYVKALQINAILFENSIDNLDTQKGISFILTTSVNNFPNVFHTLLKSTHLFDDFEQELDIWFNAFSSVEESKRTKVAEAFLIGLQKMHEGIINYLEVTEEDENCSLVSSVDLLIKNPLIFTPVPNMTTCLPALLHNYSNQSEIDFFLNEIIVSLFHMQICPKTFHKIIKRFFKVPKSESSLLSYLKSWSKQKEKSIPSNIYDEKSVYVQLSDIVIEKNEEKLTLFIDKLSKKKKTFKHLLGLVRMTLFYATQSTSVEIIAISLRAFIELSHFLSEQDKQTIVKEAFMNPLLCKNFTENSMTLLGLLPHLVSLCRNETYTAAYRELMFPKLQKLLNDESAKFDSGSFLSLVITLGLNSEDASSLLKSLLNKNVEKFYKKKKLSFWGKLLKYILKEIKPDPTEETMKKIESILLELITAEVHTAGLEEALVSYVLYHPYCIQYINVDAILDKISANLTVALISIKPDIVTYLPKPSDIISSLSIVQAILKYAPLIGEKYTVKLYKQLEKKLLEIILSNELLPEISKYQKEIEFIFEKHASLDSIVKLHDHIIVKDIDLTPENCDLLILIFTKSQDSDNLFIKLMKKFVALSYQEREESSWMHKSLIQTVTENSTILDQFHLWTEFVKVCLKDSLTNEAHICLSTLTDICTILPGKCHNTIFKMVISHSQFVQIMLSESVLKNVLVRFLNVFIKAGHVPLSSSHIPLFLSSYNATLSHTDQYLFEILLHYEKKDVDMFAYKPFLWGSAAANYYSVSESVLSQTLNRQPHPSQVTSLLIEKIINRTITEFPWNRKLLPDQLSPDEPTKYDPAFLLPLFTFILAPESPVQLNKFLNTGALSIALSSLSSENVDIRESAYLVLVRFHEHLKALQQEKEGLLDHFFDVLRNGIYKLVDEQEVTCPQLSNIISIFLARSSLIISRPSHPLYSSLHKYFIAKPVLDLKKVPEFLVLFHSENEYNRKWILCIIKDGLLSLQDWTLCDRTVIFKILFAYYSSRLCSKTEQSLICQIINKCLHIDKGRFYLITSQGLLSWSKDVPHPNSIVQTLCKHQKSDPHGFLQTLLLDSLFNSQNKEHTLELLECMCEFVQDNNSKNSTLLYEHLDLILSLVEKQIGLDVARDSRNLQRHSCQYALPQDQMNSITKITFCLLSNHAK